MDRNQLYLELNELFLPSFLLQEPHSCLPPPSPPHPQCEGDCTWSCANCSSPCFSSRSLPLPSPPPAVLRRRYLELCELLLPPFLLKEPPPSPPSPPLPQCEGDGTCSWANCSSRRLSSRSLASSSVVSPQLIRSLPCPDLGCCCWLHNYTMPSYVSCYRSRVLKFKAGLFMHVPAEHYAGLDFLRDVLL